MPVVDPVICPACASECKLSFQVADEKATDWVFCKCGTIFQCDKKTDKKHFNLEYLTKYTDYKELKARAEYFMRVYLPMVRELTYGRRFLDVGNAFDYNVNYLSDDGWVTESIDLIAEAGGLTGDFEKHDFKNKRYDFILMGRVLEAFENPIRALLKAKELLLPKGVIAIVTPDAEIVYEKGMFEFGNWNPDDKWIIFSETQLGKILTTLGFKVIMSRKDTERRGIGWNHVHIIAQKVG